MSDEQTFHYEKKHILWSEIQFSKIRHIIISNLMFAWSEGKQELSLRFCQKIKKELSLRINSLGGSLCHWFWTETQMTSLHGCLNGTTFQSLKLDATPTWYSSPRFVFPSLHKTKTPTLHSQKPPLPRPIKALSTSTTVQTSPSTTKVPDDHGNFPLLSLSVLFSFLSNETKWMNRRRRRRKN